METEELYLVFKEYFPHHIDLMKHLHRNACWEYVITEHSTKEVDIKLTFYLLKKNETSLEMTKIKPEIEPDLILYFTEEAILTMIKGTPNVEEYFRRYHKIMGHPQSGIEVDNKVNKPRLKLWQIGYKQWQKEYNF